MELIAFVSENLATLLVSLAVVVVVVLIVFSMKKEKKKGGCGCGCACSGCPLSGKCTGAASAVSRKTEQCDSATENEERPHCGA